MQGTAEFRVVNSAEQSIRSPALVVDLDGTLVKTNLLLESLVALLNEKPACFTGMVVEGKGLS